VNRRRTNNTMSSRKKDKQRSTIYYTENKLFSTYAKIYNFG